MYKSNLGVGWFWTDRPDRCKDTDYVLWMQWNCSIAVDCVDLNMQIVRVANELLSWFSSFAHLFANARTRINVYSKQYAFAHRITNACKCTLAIIYMNYEYETCSVVSRLEYAYFTDLLRRVGPRTFVVDSGRHKLFRRVSRISYGLNLDSWSQIAVSNHFMTFL